VTEKPFFREPFKRKRCLMPVSGYYGWDDTPGGKQPHYFTACDGSPILIIAGLWDEWKEPRDGRTSKIVHNDDRYSMNAQHGRRTRGRAHATFSAASVKDIPIGHDSPNGGSA